MKSRVMKSRVHMHDAGRAKPCTCMESAAGSQSVPNTPFKEVPSIQLEICYSYCTHMVQYLPNTIWNIWSHTTANPGMRMQKPHTLLCMPKVFVSKTSHSGSHSILLYDNAESQ